MKKMNKITSLIVSLVMAITYLLPFGTQEIFATGNLFILDLKQIGSGLSEGDTFGVEFDLSEQVEKVTVAASGSAVKSATLTGEVDLNKRSVSAIGFKYTGKGRDVTITANYTKLDGSTGTATESIELDATTTEESTGALSLVNSSIVSIKAGETQKTSIKVKNNGSSNIKNANVKITMPEPVEGIELKDNFTQVDLLKPKETKTINFSVITTKVVKQGKYKVNVDINGTSQTIYLKIDSNYTPPLMEVSMNGDRVLKANTPEDIAIQIKNVGDSAAKNVKVEVANNENVAIINGSNVKYIAEIGANSATQVNTKIRINNASVKTVPLQVNLTYIDESGEEKKDAQYIYLNTEGSMANTEVVISNIKGPSGTSQVDQNFTVSFSVTAKSGAKNVKLTVSGDIGIVPKSQNLFMIDSLKAGEKKDFTVTLAATKAAASSSHPIEIKAEYKNNEEAIAFSQFTSVNINNPDADATGPDGEKVQKGLPKVIIGTYKSDPVVVKAGEEFDLELGFLNTNNTKRVTNLKANLTVREEGEKATGTVFTPVGASNTFYIANLAPGETANKKIRLYTIPSANPKTYQITIEMEYEDEKGTPIKATENIGIPVEQVTKLEIADVQVDGGAQVGMPIGLSAKLYNTGKTDISNVTVQIEGEGFQVQDNKLFIGNFEKGASESYNPTIIPDQAGQLNGKITIQYEDPTGAIQTLSQDFTTEIMDMPTMPEEGMNPEPLPEPKPVRWPAIVGVIGGFGLAAIIALVVVKKRKAKLAEREFDEE